jgi:hypothetical protein
LWLTQENKGLVARVVCVGVGFGVTDFDSRTCERVRGAFQFTVGMMTGYAGASAGAVGGDGDGDGGTGAELVLDVAAAA